MKRVMTLLWFTLISTFIFAQSAKGIWDDKTATYTNSVHQITWKLFDDWDWESRPILGDGTVLKLRNNDTNILIKLGIISGVNGDMDTWDAISYFESSNYQEMHKSEAKQYGMTYNGTKISKSQLCGIHAIKERVDMSKYYPEYKQNIHFIEIVYSIFRKKCLYSISVAALSVREDEIEIFDRIASELFKGYKMN